MNSLHNRRNWLKKSLLTSTAGWGLINGIEVFGKTSLPAFPHAADPEVKRLLFNENPLGPSKEVSKIIVDTLHRANKYATFYTV